MENFKQLLKDKRVAKKVIPKGRKIPSGIHVDFAGDGDFLAHRFITHNSQLLTKIVLFLRRTRLYSFFTVFTAKACPVGKPGAIFGLRPFILLRLGKANKFVLLSASA